MASLAAGSNITLSLGAYDSVSVEVPAGGACVVEYPVGTRIAYVNSGSRVFGPYASGGSVKLTAEGVAIRYDSIDGTLPGDLDESERSALQALVSGAGILVGQTGVPVILPSGGTIGNNGALSGITALPTTYSQGCYMYFPAAAISAASLAGIYYVVMSSTTAGTIYNNTYTIGQPTIPDVLVPFVTTGPGAFVQATSQIDLITFPVPANAMGKNGRLVIRGRASNNNNANSKSPRVAFGTMQLVNNSTASQLGGEFYSQVQNRGVTNAQVAPAASFSTMGLTTNAAARGTEDTTAVVNVVFGCTVPTAGDYVMWESASVDCIKLV